MRNIDTITLHTRRFNSDGDEPVAFGPVTVSDSAELPSQYGGTAWSTVNKTVYGAGLLTDEDNRRNYSFTAGKRIGFVQYFDTQEEAHAAAKAWECDTFGPFEQRNMTRELDTDENDVVVRMYDVPRHLENVESALLFVNVATGRSVSVPTCFYDNGVYTKEGYEKVLGTLAAE